MFGGDTVRRNEIIVTLRGQRVKYNFCQNDACMHGFCLSFLYTSVSSMWKLACYSQETNNPNISLTASKKGSAVLYSLLSMQDESRNDACTMSHAQWLIFPFLQLTIAKNVTHCVIRTWKLLPKMYVLLERSLLT